MTDLTQNICSLGLRNSSFRLAPTKVVMGIRQTDRETDRQTDRPGHILLCSRWRLCSCKMEICSWNHQTVHLWSVMNISSTPKFAFKDQLWWTELEIIFYHRNLLNIITLPECVKIHVRPLQYQFFSEGPRTGRRIKGEDCLLYTSPSPRD